MDITDLLKLKLKNELLLELSEYDIEELESQIDDKITGDLFTKEVREKQNDILDKDRCCARSTGPPILSVILVIAIFLPVGPSFLTHL